MEELPSLKLIKAVDPSKVKVAINQKFAKLTLSSNKKKDVPNNAIQDPVKIEKRRSASRSLFLNDIENSAQKKHEKDYSLNAILRRSSSSSIVDNEKTTTFTETCNLDITEDLDNPAASMEKLEISEEHTARSNDELESLTQKVSSLNVSSKADIKTEKEINSSNFGEELDLELTPEIIDIISSSDDTESIISILDTTSEDDYKDANCMDYSIMITSDIMQGGGTGELQMPCTLSNERADRLEAFLRDVSQERKNIFGIEREQNETINPNYIIKSINSPKNLEELTKAKEIATADTESMTTISTQIGHASHVPPTKDVGKDKPCNVVFDETETMTDFNLTNIQLEPQHLQSFQKDEQEEIRVSEERRHANDETEANTTLNSLLDGDSIHERHYETLGSDDDIVIPETSSDDVNSSNNATDLSVDENKNLIPSEEVISRSPEADSPEQPAVGISMGSINISAKIQIKLKIQAEINYSSDDDDISSKSATSVGEDEKSDVSSEGTEDGETYTANVVAEKEMPKTKIDCKPEDLLKTPMQNQSSVGIKNDFATVSEKILNELYGNTWKTPDVIRKLKKSSDAPKINDVENNDKEEDCKENEKPLITFGKPKTAEDTLIDDFSTFRINIAKTNLDSTRLVTPQPGKNKTRAPTNCGTEPKSRVSREKGGCFKMPQTEIKTKRTTTTRPGRIVRKRIPQLLNHNRDSDISDDSDVNKTVFTNSDEEERSNASDSSWHKSLSESGSDEDNSDHKNSRSNNRSKINAPPSKVKGRNKSKKNKLIYMDLSKDEVTILKDTPTCSPPANNDVNFRKRLSQLLDSCRYQDRPKMDPTPKSTGKSKRRLFNGNFGTALNFEDDNGEGEARVMSDNPKESPGEESSEDVRFNGVPIPPSFNIYNKRLEAIKTGKPVFPITPNRSKVPIVQKTPIASREEDSLLKTTTPSRKMPTTKIIEVLKDLSSTPKFKYSFLKSLDVCVCKSMCHPDALVFRENYRQKREDLAQILYELYNGKLFKNNLDVPIVWNKKLLNTAGRCLNKRKLGQRLSVVELSEKVLTSADRLRCTLIHELCHAATWVFSGEGGHGATWKEWARKANAEFPDLPKIGVCHQYDIEYKYTYKCTLCAAKSYYHSKSKKVENIRCSFCHGAIEVFLNKKDKDGNVMHTPVREPTGFAKFVKDNYQQYKRSDMKHADVMKVLSNEFAALKVIGKTN